MNKKQRATCVNREIENYRKFLLSTYEDLQNLIYAIDWDGNGVELYYDYLELNWELLVEASMRKKNLNISLRPLARFGAGKKILKEGSAVASHAVFVVSKDASSRWLDENGNEISRNRLYELNDFESSENKNEKIKEEKPYYVAGPHDKLLIREYLGERVFTVSIGKERFQLMSLPEAEKSVEV